MQSISGFSLPATSTVVAAPTVDPLEKATQEFEALFIGYLLKVMRSTVDATDADSFAKGKDIYMEMFDNEIALTIAKTRSLGVGEMMFRQLQEKEAASKLQTIVLKELKATEELKAISGKVLGESHDN